MQTAAKGTFVVVARLCYFSTVGTGEQKNALRLIRDWQGSIKLYLHGRYYDLFQLCSQMVERELGKFRKRADVHFFTLPLLFSSSVHVAPTSPLTT
jgi:hypothetical protein